MTAEALYQIVAERGLTIRVDSQGRSVVFGDPEQATPALLDALTTHRKAILTMLGLGVTPPKPVQPEKQPESECLYPGNGYISPLWFPEIGFPAGAYFVRRIGESDWQAIPERTWDEGTKRGKVL